MNNMPRFTFLLELVKNIVRQTSLVCALTETNWNNPQVKH